MAIHGGFASCDRHRCGASGPVRAQASPAAGTLAPTPSAPLAQAAQALSPGAAPAESTGSALVDRALVRLLPTEVQLAYVDILVERYGVAGPRAGLSRGEISRWIDEVKSLYEA